MQNFVANKGRLPASSKDASTTAAPQTAAKSSAPSTSKDPVQALQGTEKQKGKRKQSAADASHDIPDERHRPGTAQEIPDPSSHAISSKEASVTKKNKNKNKKSKKGDLQQAVRATSDEIEDFPMADGQGTGSQPEPDEIEEDPATTNPRKKSSASTAASASSTIHSLEAHHRDNDGVASVNDDDDDDDDKVNFHLWNPDISTWSAKQKYRLGRMWCWIQYRMFCIVSPFSCCILTSLIIRKNGGRHQQKEYSLD